MKARYQVLILLLCIPLLCIGTFVFGYFWGTWRMDTARTELFEVAALLGYEPSVHLYDAIEQSNASLVDGSRRCNATLIYTTPLTESEFVWRLEQLPGATAEKQGLISAWSNLFMSIDLTVNGVHRWEDAEYDLKFIDKWQYYWDIENKSIRIFFFDVSVLDFPVEYQGQPLTKNVVHISKGRGIFPIWLRCPVQYHLETGATTN